MRMWSLHPQYLDRQGLTGCWRESLLAQAVLAGRTRGYTNHSQLQRFRAHPDPLAAVGAYLLGLAAEASTRGYRFDVTRIDRPGDAVARIPVTDGQVAYEWGHLAAKLAARTPERAATQALVTTPAVHPLFVVVPGPLEPWERP